MTFEKIETALSGLESKLSRLDELEKNVKHHDTCITELAQKSTGYRAGMVDGGMRAESKSFAEQAAEAFEQKSADFKSHRNLSIEIPTEGLLVKSAKGAADPLITTSNVATMSELGVGNTGVYGFGFQHAMSSVASVGLDVAHYTRILAGQTDGAALVVPEGEAKPSVLPKFAEITQKSMTLAALTPVSEQVLASAPSLQNIISTVLQSSLNRAVDKVLVNGATNPAWDGFGKLATAFTSAYKTIPEAITESMVEFAKRGLRATHVVLHPADYLTVINERTTYGEPLVSYLGDPATQTLRGLTVVISENVAAGKPVLVDAAQVELRVAQTAVLTFGYVNDQFAKNQVMARLETRIAPVMFATDSVLAVTLKV